MLGINKNKVYLLFSAMAACLWLRKTNKHTHKEECGFSGVSEQLTWTVSHGPADILLFNTAVGSTGFTALV